MRIFSRRGGWSKHISASYRSGLEDKVAEQLRAANINFAYESYAIDYSIPETGHVYTPDFVLPNGIIIETKGLFDATDRNKHLLIKSQHPELDIRFVFSSVNTKLYKGSPTTYGAWCTKNGFQYAHKWIPESWMKETKKDTKGLYEKKEKIEKEGG